MTSPTVRESDANLVDILDRLIDTGVTVSGDLVLSVAGVDLVWLGLRAVLSSVEALRQEGSVAYLPPKAPVHTDRVEPVRATEGGPARSERAAAGAVEAPARQTPPFTASRQPPGEIAIRGENVEKGLVQLVLTVVDLLRQLMERQAVRRLDGSSLGEDEAERLGLAFLRLSERMEDLKSFFGLDDEDLALNLGPVGYVS